jgi:hypothetical protein
VGRLPGIKLPAAAPRLLFPMANLHLAHTSRETIECTGSMPSRASGPNLAFGAGMCSLCFSDRWLVLRTSGLRSNLSDFRGRLQLAGD